MLSDTHVAKPQLSRRSAKVDKILNKFATKSVDEYWAFASKTRRETSYLTHGYHRYPAKYIPQLASELIMKYSSLGDIVVDPFGGCGTTAVEAKVNGRFGFTVDVNPVAAFITRVKTESLSPNVLQRNYLNLMASIKEETDVSLFTGKEVTLKAYIPDNKRIDYWFPEEQKRKLGMIRAHIESAVQGKKHKDFFLCAFSNILKNCSWWHQSSNKPLHHKEKQTVDPIKCFDLQCRKMLRGNEDFYNCLKQNGNLKIPCKTQNGNAKKILLNDGEATLVVTSPPYVTSYEYADLHQLTAFWFEYTKDLHQFRGDFIGSAYVDREYQNLQSHIAETICRQFDERSAKMARQVAIYFSDMSSVFKEMQRILCVGGKICVVIGNTKLRGVEILNAEAFAEQLQNLGFALKDVIKREIPSKNLPSTRDPRTGKFTSASAENKVLAYPTEYIVVAEKK